MTFIKANSIIAIVFLLHTNILFSKQGFPIIFNWTKSEKYSIKIKYLVKSEVINSRHNLKWKLSTHPSRNQNYIYIDECNSKLEDKSFLIESNYGEKIESCLNSINLNYFPDFSHNVLFIHNPTTDSGSILEIEIISYTIIKHEKKLEIDSKIGLVTNKQDLTTFTVTSPHSPAEHYWRLGATPNGWLLPDGTPAPAVVKTGPGNTLELISTDALPDSAVVRCDVRAGGNLYDMGQCIVTKKDRMLPPPDIRQTFAPLEFEVFPNPANELITFALPEIKIERVTAIELTDLITGKVVKSLATA